MPAALSLWFVCFTYVLQMERKLSDFLSSQVPSGRSELHVLALNYWLSIELLSLYIWTGEAYSTVMLMEKFLLGDQFSTQ